VSTVAPPARLSTGLPSPQFTLTPVTVPSGSAAEKVKVTDCPVLAGLGETLLIPTNGGRSLTVSETVLDPVLPLLSAAVTVIVNP